MFDVINGPLLRTNYWVVLPDGTTRGNALVNYGAIPGSRLPASVQPSAADTVTIGGKVFTFVASLGAAASNLQVLRGANAAAAYAALRDAINGLASAKDVTWRESTSAFATSVVADMVTSTQLRLRQALARGGNAAAGVSGSIALAASITGGASAWSIANLNASGQDPLAMATAYGSIVITSAMISAGGIDVEFEFQPLLADIQVADGTGLIRQISDLVTIPANQLCLHIQLAGGSSPHVQPGDTLTWRVAG